VLETPLATDPVVLSSLYEMWQDNCTLRLPRVLEYYSSSKLLD